MVTHGTNWWLVLRQMDTHCTNRLFNSRIERCLNLYWLLFLNPTFHYEKVTELVASQHHIHEHEKVFGFVFEVCFCSSSSLTPHQQICVEHWVFTMRS